MASDFKNYRRYPRFSILGKAVITRRDEGSPGRLTAMVNTISQGGMGFYTDVFFEKTTPVSVELLFDSSDTADALPGRIASICSQGKDYFVGIAFDREIPYERLAEMVG
jgi:hypothetical protein